MIVQTTNGSATEIRQTLKEIPIEKLAFRFFPAYVASQFPSYRFAPHNRMIADRLMRIESGEINRLMVFMPPRHGKTMLISEMFPPWYLGRNPDKQIISATYSFERATDTGRKVRNHMVDPIHNKIFRNCRLAIDSKSAYKLSTEAGGNMFSVGVNGTITGRGANLFIIDDPVKNREDAESTTSRRKLADWYRGVAYTRLMPDNAIILVMTRWHFDDLAGFLQEEMLHENWEILKLPAICEDLNDPCGRQPGEALWPTDYPVEKLEQIKETVGTREWNAQFQQTPLPDDGGMVNINWFERYNYGSWVPVEMVLRLNGKMPQLPFDITQIVLSWDTAFKEKEINDPSSCTVWGISKNKYYLLNRINKRMAYPTLKKVAIETWQKYNRCLPGATPVLIEDKASGQSLIQDLRNHGGIPVIAIKPEGNKQTRMSVTSPMIEAGQVFLPERSAWLVSFETQFARFPLWREDDDVDSTSQFLAWVGKVRYKPSKIRFWK